MVKALLRGAAAGIAGTAVMTAYQLAVAKAQGEASRDPVPHRWAERRRRPGRQEGGRGGRAGQPFTREDVRCFTNAALAVRRVVGCSSTQASQSTGSSSAPASGPAYAELVPLGSTSRPGSTPRRSSRRLELPRRVRLAIAARTRSEPTSRYHSASCSTASPTSSRAPSATCARRESSTRSRSRRAMREIRLALLEADVNFTVVRDFVAHVREKALGDDILKCAHARPAGREGRARRADGADGRGRVRARVRQVHGDPARRPAGLGQDDDRRRSSRCTCASRAASRASSQPTCSARPRSTSSSSSASRSTCRCSAPTRRTRSRRRAAASSARAQRASTP